MKVFIYTKDKTSKKVREITGVESVYEDKANHVIIFTQQEGIEARVNTKLFKTATYQN